ncbi:phenylalanine--tRNA ligase beta subunit [Clostridia bacterium]|nr:phenylalanine--tRNA ligase beta subunit [Clostridia bacterium]
MQLSLKWLKDYVDLRCSIKEYCHRMTLSGSKVEGFSEQKLDFVVIGQVKNMEKHPNSDHMFITQIDIGESELLQIVTGAQNVNIGDFLPVATIGADLPNGLKIKKSKLRGVESNGMLCSLSELGLTKNDFPYAIEDGIFIIDPKDLGANSENSPIGKNAAELLGLDDVSVEFEITSNRPDCLSVIGLARETAATFNTIYSVEEPSFKGVSGENNLSVTIQNSEKCKRYCAGLVKNVKIEPSPRWMRERLKSSGVRPINNLVDITNYVMLEYGQPMHAFDLRFVDGEKIVVRDAFDGEKIMTLDGVTRELSSDMLVIADATHPIGIAGIMGGEHSGIMPDTNTVVFESAYFEPISLRKTAKKLGMRSDASSRYEKGVDPKISLTCLKRAFELVELLGAGEVIDEIIDVDYTQATPACVSSNKNLPLSTSGFCDSQEILNFSNKIPLYLDAEWTNDFLGTNISEKDMVDYLERLDFTVVTKGTIFERGKITVPSFRIDIESKADIAEEIARLYGYDNIQSTKLRGVAEAEFTNEQKFIRTVNTICSAVGCNEIATFSFISPKELDKICLPIDSKLRNTVKISNPLGEDTSIMRTTTIPSMLEIIAINNNNRNLSGKFFEIGKEYIPTSPDTLPKELDRLTIGCYGETDFYILKGIIETLLEKIGILKTVYNTPNGEFEEQIALHPYRCAVIGAKISQNPDDKKFIPLGIFGQIHPNVAKNYDFDTPVFVAKLEIDTLLQLSKNETIYKSIPKFPSITRDLALVCDEKITSYQLETIIKKSIGSIFESISLFDVYRDQKLGENKKSLAYSIVMRSPDSTLTDDLADKAIAKTLKNISELANIR